MTIADIVGTYLAHMQRLQKKSIRNARSHASHLLQVPLAHMTVRAFNPETYQEKRRREGAKNATINRECEILKQAASHWHKTFGDVVPLRHVPRLPENNVRQGFFTAEEFERIALALPVHLNLFARFAHITGWRKSEIAGLRLSDVDLGANTIRLRDSKNGEGRVIPVSGRLVELVVAATALPGEGDLLFHDAQGRPVRDFRKAWARACSEAGCPGRLFHDLRRTAVRNMIAAGVDRQVAKAITGHKTDSMFTRYQIVDTRQMTAALEKL